MFRKKLALKVVPKVTPAISTPCLLNSYLSKWDWSARDNVGGFLRNAWLGMADQNPEHFVVLFAQVKECIDQAFARENKEARIECAEIAIKILDAWWETADHNDLLPFQRAVGILLVFDAEPLEREIVIGRMAQPSLDPTFAFRSALALAKLRDPEHKTPLLHREELFEWKRLILAEVNRVDMRIYRQHAASALKIIEQTLAGLPTPELHPVSV